MSFNGTTPQEKIVKICLEDHANGNSRTICFGRLDLAEVVKECITNYQKTVEEDISLSQNLGMMTLSITPRRMELREKVTMALSKPPVHTPISRIPTSPIKSPTKVFQQHNTEIKLSNMNSEITFENLNGKENWNDISFCPPEGEFQEHEVSEGECHHKTERKKRSSSQITKKKPFGMNKTNSNRPTQQHNRPYNYGAMSDAGSEFNSSQQPPKRGGSSIRGWIEDSVQKLGGSDSYSSFFENSVFSTAQKEKATNVKTKERYRRNKSDNAFGKNGRCNTEEYEVKEPPRPLYFQMDESDRMSKLSCTNSDAVFLSQDNSMMSSISSLPHFNEKDLCQNSAEKAEFISKFNEAKQKEKKYKKEVKILKMEKKQLQLKTEDVDKHLQEQAEKIITKAIVKIQDKLESSSKPKLGRVICKSLLSPLCKLLSVTDSTLSPLLDIIKLNGKDGNKAGLDTTPIKLSKRSKELEKEYKAQLYDLTQRIKLLEKENQDLKNDVLESSKLHNLHNDKVEQEKMKVEELKKEILLKGQEDRKQQEDVHSKITNYKTRIFFLESQVEELETKLQSQVEMATTKLKNKLKSCESDLKAAQKAKDAAESKLTGLRDKLEEVIQEEQKYKRMHKEDQAAINKLNEKVESLEKKLVEVKTELADKMYQYEMK